MPETFAVQLRRQLADARAGQAALAEKLAPFSALLGQKAIYDSLVQNLEEALRLEGLDVVGYDLPAATSGYSDAEEPLDEAVHPPVIQVVHSILRENPRKILRADWIWRQAEERGCVTTVRPPYKAARYALYQLKKQGINVRHVARSSWRYFG